ncbi:ATP-binding protein [Candidatus Bipolaricaulota sp. J31]
MSLEERLARALEAGEHERCEFRRSFGKEALRTLCAFANTKGGELWIGVKDDGEIVGASTGREGLRDWAHRIREELGISAHLESGDVKGQEVVCITVEESLNKPVRYRGRAYVRSGSSDRLATEEEETRWVLERTGQTWDALPEPRARWEHLDPDQIRRFRRLCNQKGRRPIPPDEDDRTVLRKLGLLAEDGTPTRAAVLLFGREPQRFYLNAVVKIGRFRSPTVIVDDREIYGTLFDQVEETLGYFREHLETRFEFTGEPAREVIWEYPLGALREAVINAVIHRDYLDSGHVQVRWYDDHLVILSPGTIPPPLTIEDLKRPHRSALRNRLIAEMFYYAGWIERWGTGIQKILDECREAGLPEPEWREDQGAVWLTFRKDIWTEDYLRSLGLNDRQIKAVMWVKERGSITNAEYQRIAQTSRETAKRELARLVDLGVFVRKGAGRKVAYEMGQTGQKRVRNGSKGHEGGTHAR